MIFHARNQILFILFQVVAVCAVFEFVAQEFQVCYSTNNAEKEQQITLNNGQSVAVCSNEVDAHEEVIKSSDSQIVINSWNKELEDIQSDELRNDGECCTGKHKHFIELQDSQAILAILLERFFIVVLVHRVKLTYHVG